MPLRLNIGGKDTMYFELNETISIHKFCENFISDWMKDEEAELHHLCANSFEFKEFYHICQNLPFASEQITFIATYNQIIVELNERILVITV